MTFIPLTPEQGALLDKLSPLVSRLAALQQKPRAALRTAIPAHPYAPVDGYEPELKKMRAELAAAKPVMPKPPCPFDTPGYDGKSGVAPDPYRAGLEKMRKEQ